MMDWRQIERELVEFFEAQHFLRWHAGGDVFMEVGDLEAGDDFNITELARRMANLGEVRR
jgi:hypothetical protein